MHNLNRKGEIAPPCQTPVLPVCSVMRTIFYIIHLYGKMAFVKALLYLCRSSMEVQHALCGGQWSILGARLCRVQQIAKKSHYQSMMFVCVSSNRTDAVDRLLIHKARLLYVVIFICQKGFGRHAIS